MKLSLLIVALLVVPAAAQAAKPCEELKSEIAAKLDAKHVAGYTLEIVGRDAAADRKVVGTCDGGTHAIVYSRNGGAAATATATSAATATSTAR